MSRILYAWELGGDLGHISGFLPLARELVTRGHEVLFALRDLANAEALLSAHGMRYLQAPVWQREPKGLQEPPLNYAEILLRFGFLEVASLATMVKAWRELFLLAAPDLLIADHAPSALLAARTLALRGVAYGSGFCVPPRAAVSPNMRPWLAVPDRRLRSSDAHVLSAANAVLAGLGGAPMTTLGDLFAVEENFLLTLPELDHYGSRGRANYWGPIIGVEDGVNLVWPEDGASKRIFAYLKPQHRDCEAVLRALQALPCSAGVFCPGIAPELAARYASPRLAISRTPLRLASLIAGCDLAICHSGSMVAALLLGGVPLLLLPLQLEQFLAAARVVDLGAGLLVNPEQPAPDYVALIGRMLDDPSFKARARGFAAKYASYDHAAQPRRIADRIDQILAPARA